MSALITPCSIVDALLVTPTVHGDDRGLLVETFRQEWLGANAPFMVQSNRAQRRCGAVVGLHFHCHQADYWHVVIGTARVVLHDLRVTSPSFGVTWVHDLVGHVPQGIYVPPGVAHGFSALTDVTLTYLVDQVYTPDDEHAVAWNDPEIGADWGVADPVLSERDRVAPLRSSLDLAAIEWR
jgi:dTDP-4-dehydrorhamnose 3,5-epimerase